MWFSPCIYILCRQVTLIISHLRGCVTEGPFAPASCNCDIKKLFCKCICVWMYDWQAEDPRKYNSLKMAKATTKPLWSSTVLLIDGLELLEQWFPARGSRAPEGSRRVRGAVRLLGKTLTWWAGFGTTEAEWVREESVKYNCWLKILF